MLELTIRREIQIEKIVVAPCCRLDRPVIDDNVFVSKSGSKYQTPWMLGDASLVLQKVTNGAINLYEEFIQVHLFCHILPAGF